MADQVSSLVFRVDATSVNKGEQALDRLTAAAGRAENAALSLSTSPVGPTLAEIAQGAQRASAAMGSLAKASESLSQANTNVAQASQQAAAATNAEQEAMARLLTAVDPILNSLGAVATQASQAANGLNRFNTATQSTGASANQAKQGIDNEKDALARLLGEIDPVTRALDRLDKQQQELGRARSRGLLDTDTFNDYNAKIEEARRRTTGFADSTGKMGISAAAAANNLRMLPAQITDITVGLATGQAPMMVFLQQGGQLKDIFGGVGPALKAVGTYVLGLINPFTLAAAAAAALGLAFYQGSRQTSLMNEAIITSGNVAGVTTSDLQTMAKAISNVDGTVGKATTTLSAFVKSGAVSRDMLQASAQAAQTWEKATGQSVDEVVENFKRLEQEPVQAIQKLNEQYNFLDAATLQRIQSLENLGQKEEAAALAQKTYSDAIQARGNEIITNLGFVERAWNTLAGVAKSAWDAMMGIGRTDGTAQALQAAEERLIQLQDGAYQRGAANRVRQVEEQRKIVEGLRQRLKAEQDAAKAEADRQRLEKGGIEGITTLSNYRTQYATQEQRRQNELKKAQDAYNKAIAAPSLTLEKRNELEREYKDIVSNINKQFDKRSTTTTTANRSTESLLDRLRGINAQLLAQSQTDEKIGSAANRLIEYEQKFADLKEERTLTAQEKILLSQESQVIALLREGAELENTITKREALVKLTERANSAMASLQSSAENRAEQYAREESVFGLGDRIRKQVEAENSIRREFNRAQTQLTKNVNLGLIDPAELEKRQQAIRDLQAQELDNTRQHFARMESLEQDWTKSFQESISNAADSMRTAFQIAGAATNVVFQNMTEGLTTFVTTGKLNFKDLTVSILNGLAQIAVQAAASKIFSLVGSFFNPTASASFVSGGNALNYLPGRANGGPVQANSMYRVNERGPELYSENGKTYLMAGGNGGYVTPISNNSTPISSGSSGVEVSVYVSGDGNNRTDTNNDAYRGLGDEIGRLVDQRIQQMQVRSYRPGGLSWSANNGRLA